MVIINQYQSFPVPKSYELYPRLKTMYDMIEEIRKVYNAYTYRKKLEVYLLPTRTTYDSEITIEYGKNLKELTKTENWDNFAGIIDTLIPQPNNWDKSKEYTCPDAYFFPPQGLTKKDCHKTVSFQSIISADDYNNVSDYVAAITAEQEQQALEYFQKYAKPIVSYNFKGNIDGNVDLGAIILVRDLQIGANIETVVIGFQYDLISKKYVEVSFGNSAESIKGYNNRIDDKLKISEKNSPLLTYPVGSIYVNSGASPNMGGFWELQSSSGGLYTWKRTA